MEIYLRMCIRDPDNATREPRVYTRTIMLRSFSDRARIFFEDPIPLWGCVCVRLRVPPGRFSAFLDGSENC